MRQGWSQIWSDLLASLKSGAPVGGSDNARTDGADGKGTAKREEAETVADGAALPQERGAESRTSPSGTGRRELVLLASVSGAIVVVLAALVVWILLPYFISPTRPSPSSIIASFDGGEITLADLEEHLKMLSPARQQAVRQSVDDLLSLTEEMISDQIALKWAAQRQPETEETFRHAMQHIDEELSLDTLSNQIRSNDINVPESEIRNYFEANADKFQGRPFAAVRDEIHRIITEQKAPQYMDAYLARLRANSLVERNFELLEFPSPAQDELDAAYRAASARYTLPRRVLVDEIEVPIAVFGDGAQTRANDILLRLRGGERLEDVVARDEGLRMMAGREVASGEQSQEWESNVFALMTGEFASVFRAGESFFVVKLLEMKEPRLRSFEEVRGEVLAEVSRSKEEKWFADNGPKTLLTLKGQRYSMAQFYKEYLELPEDGRERYAGVAGMKKLADRLADRLLMLSDTDDKMVNLSNKPLSDEARIGLLKQMMEQEEIDDKIQVSDAEVEDFYRINRTGFTAPAKARIRYIRIGSGGGDEEKRIARARAQEAYSKLTDRAAGDLSEFADVAREYSEDSDSAAKGGQLDGWVGENVNPFADVADHPFHQTVLELEQGQVSAPFELAGSIYIVEVLEKTAPRRMPFNEVKTTIRDAFLRSKHRELSAQLRDAQLRQYNVKKFPALLSAYVATRDPVAALQPL